MRDLRPEIVPAAEAAIDTLNGIAAARAVEDVWSLTTGILAGFGFERVSYGLTFTRSGRSIGDPRDVLFLSTHPLSSMREHHENCVYLKTPEHQWVMANVGAVSWGWAHAQRAAGRLSREECDAMDGMSPNRRRAGYSISFVEGTQRSRGTMGLAAAQGVSQVDLDEDWRRFGSTVLAICNMAHFKICSLPLPLPGLTLTDRQRELLEWTADGKTTRDIAVLTGLSVSSVEKHLRRARDVLDVETTAQAVAKASLLNQMFIGTEADLDCGK